MGSKRLLSGLASCEVIRGKEAISLGVATDLTGAEYTRRVSCREGFEDPEVAVLVALISRCLVSLISGP